MNLGALRAGQRKALDVIAERLRARERFTTIVLPTRYGKSDVIRLAALKAADDGIARHSIALSPYLNLRNQLIEPHKQLPAFLKRYGIHSQEQTNRFDYLRSFGNTYAQLFNHGQRTLLSATMQLALADIPSISALADEVCRRGEKLLVHIDECHEVSEEKARGKLIELLKQAGASFILYTGTPIREDGEMIPGFELETFDERERNRYVPKDILEDGTRIVSHYVDSQCFLKLKAHHQTTMREAWNEQLICRLGIEFIDARDIGCQWFSALSENDARRQLRTVLNDPKTILACVRHFVDSLLDFKRVQPEAAGLVFTGSDHPGDLEANRHGNALARAIRAECERRGIRRLRTRILTMKTDDDDAADILKRFCEDEDEHDVLILKQMGTVGLDCERAKVELDMSSVRSPGRVIQRLMRIATPWRDLKTAKVIALRDPLMQRIWNDFIVEEGGEWDGAWHTQDTRFVRDIPRPPKPPPGPESQFDVIDATLNAYTDDAGLPGDMKDRRGIMILRRVFPEPTRQWTDPETALKWRELVEVMGAEEKEEDHQPPISTPDERRESLRQRINQVAAAIANQNMGVSSYRELKETNPQSVERWRQILRDTINHAKKRAGVSLSCELGDLLFEPQLERMLEALENMRNALG